MLSLILKMPHICENECLSDIEKCIEVRSDVSLHERHHIYLVPQSQLGSPDVFVNEANSKLLVIQFQYFYHIAYSCI